MHCSKNPISADSISVDFTLVQLTKGSKCTYLLRAFFLLDSRLGLLLIDLVRFHLMQQISGPKKY